MPTLTRPHCHTHTPTPTIPRLPTHVHTPTPTLPRQHSHTPTQTLQCPHSHAHIITPTLPHSHSHAHTPTPTILCPHSHAHSPKSKLPQAHTCVEGCWRDYPTEAPPLLIYMLEFYAVPQLEDMQPQVFFQQNGAPPHWSLQVCDFLNENFPTCWIWRDGPIPWPLHSPDITPMDS
ncbi:putative proline-rich protein 21 [Homarus americanus]|uniref:putative proline-rich protein 21 n=1 Tax=Homarus americanus TaxID=6706 RepID=UPI001C466B46|nr:putative proline-rich protein 21 [Homarus americanus]